MNEASRRKYEAELSRLDEEIARLQEEWRHIPRFALFALLAPPIAWCLQGFSAALVTLLVALALVGTRAYLIGVRVSENRWTRESLERELAQTADQPDRAPNQAAALRRPAHA